MPFPAASVISGPSGAIVLAVKPSRPLETGKSRWAMAVGFVLVLQSVLFALVAFIPPSSQLSETLEAVPVTLEDWPVFPPPEPMALPKSATSKAIMAQPKPVSPSVMKPREALANPTPDNSVRPVETLPVAPTAPPTAEAPSAPGVVTLPNQRQVLSHLSERNAAIGAVIKHDICVTLRAQGKPIPADCPLNPTKQIVLGPRVEPESKRQACIRKRHEDWKRYREGHGQYPGLINMFKGNSDCRKDWD